LEFVKHMKRNFVIYIHKSHKLALFAVLIGLLAATILVRYVFSMSTVISFEAEDTTQLVCSDVLNDTSASKGKAVLFGSGSNCQTQVGECVAEGVCNYNLVWGDEFNGTSLDTTKWAPMNNSNYGSGNREDQCLFARNITTSGGYANITGKEETVTCGNVNPDGGNNTYYFTSGFMVSKYDWNKGYVEASVKAPKGNPWWAGFWLRGGTGAPAWPDYGEVDIFELVGIEPDHVHQTFHWNCADYNANSRCQTAGQGNLHNFNTGETGTTYCFPSILGIKQTSDNFNTYNGFSTSRYVRYGLLWTSDSYTWYVDGKPTIKLGKDGILTMYRRNNSPLSTKSGCTDGQSSTVAYTVDYNKKYTTNQLQSLRNSFEYNRTINLNLSFGGGFPRGAGYTGNETTTGYDYGNLIREGVPGVMSIDYLRVYKQK
jgi:beta-glucanase (GH16 family)